MCGGLSTLKDKEEQDGDAQYPYAAHYFLPLQFNNNNHVLVLTRMGMT